MLSCKVKNEINSLEDLGSAPPGREKCVVISSLEVPGLAPSEKEQCVSFLPGAAPD